MTFQSSRLDGKVVVITGGAGEIGKVLVQKFVERGSIVVITGRTIASLEATAESVAKKFGKHNRVYCLAMDCGDWASLQSGFSKIKELCGHIDVLVNNAGIAGAQQRLDRLPFTEEQAHAVSLETNCHVDTVEQSIQGLMGGPWLTTLAAYDLFATRASVVNVSTIFSKTEYYGRIPYAVSKAGLNALSAIMADELGKTKGGIRVNTVYPGPVAGERIARVFAKMDSLKDLPVGSTERSILENMTLKPEGSVGHLLTKDEIADSVVFLASPDSAGLTGQNIEITHGLKLPTDSSVNVVENPQLSRVDFCKRAVWIICGDDDADTVAAANRFRELGANVFVSIRNSILSEKLVDRNGITSMNLDVHDLQSWKRSFHAIQDFIHSLVSIVVFPGAHSSTASSELTAIDHNEVNRFLKEQIEEAIVISHHLDNFLRQNDAFFSQSPQITFVSHSSGASANSLTRIYATAVQQLIRIWRHEAMVDFERGLKKLALKVNQLCRHENTAADNQKIVADWLAYLAGGVTEFKAIDLLIDPALIYSSSGLRIAGDRDVQVLSALHSQKVALITGGSEGIGGEISRHLVLAGARITIAERSGEKLERVRAELVRMARSCGYSDPAERIHLMPDCDVTKEETIKSVVEETVTRFGRLDYVINNAGLTGAEKMVVDMPVGSWSQTLEGNLISNYFLMLEALPQLKLQGSGVVLNMSSYFGSSRHGLVPYTNRADYAVSKAAQIAMAEAFAPIIGPNIFINAFAPGPVDGARLNGRIGYPGLYSRRARLILENKTVNLLYSVLVTSIRNGADPESMAFAFASNDFSTLQSAALKNGPNAELEKYTTFMSLRIKSGYTPQKYFMNSVIAEMTMRRLQLAGFLSSRIVDKHVRVTSKEPAALFSQEEIDRGAEDLRSSIVRHCSMGKMPSDRDLAFQVVWSLAGQAETGEVLYPSGGFRYEGLHIGKNFRADGVNLNAQLIHKSSLEPSSDLSVLILGDALIERMADLAAHFVRFLAPNHSRRHAVVIAVGSDLSRTRLEREFDSRGMRGKVEIILETSRSLDLAIGQLVSTGKKPNVVISFPLMELVSEVQDGQSSCIGPTEQWRNLPKINRFRELVHAHLTNHFSVIKASTLIDDCKTILVSSGPGNQPSPVSGALAQMFSQALKPLVLAAGKEASHLNHNSEVFQIDADLKTNDFCRLIEFICTSTADESVTQKAA